MPRWFARCFGLTLPALVIHPAPAQGGPFDVKTVRVADGVYAFIETKQNPIVSGNIIAVIGDDGVLIYDAGHHPPVTRSIIAGLKRITSKAVRYVVVSHWHDDHWVGAAEFADAYPGVEVIAHPFTARLMDARKEKFRGAACQAELRDDSQPLRDQLASGKRPDGTLVTPDLRQRLEQFVAAVDSQSVQCNEMRYHAVDRRVARSLTLQLGHRAVSLEYLGRGNTAGDLIAWIPGSKLLLTGDLLVHPFPYATESYISEWARVLRVLDRRNPRIIVPGHGQPMHDRQYLRQVASVLESIARQARAAYRPGMTADQLRERIDLTAFSEQFAHGDAFIKANFDYMMRQSAVNRMWQELSGQWIPEDS